MAFNPIAPLTLLAGLFVQVRHVTGRNAATIPSAFAWQTNKGRVAP